MARHRPHVLLEDIDSSSETSLQVIEIEQLFIVVYKGKPINLRLVNLLSDYPGPKYRRTVYTQEGYAANLAKKLNERFDCNDFSVLQYPQ